MFDLFTFSVVLIALLAPSSFTFGNSPPSDINATNLTIAENSAIGTVIGEFNATDPDGEGNFTYLVASIIKEPNFFPEALPRLTAWFDASDENTLTISNDGRDLVSWANKVNLDIKLWGSLSSMPTTGASINQLNAVKFDGSSGVTEYVKADNWNPAGANGSITGDVGDLSIFLAMRVDQNARSWFPFGFGWGDHLFWSNGTAYWRYSGGRSSTNIVSNGETLLLAFDFSVTRGSQRIFKNGHQLASNPRTESTQIDGSFHFPSTLSTSSDYIQMWTVGEVLVSKSVLNDECRQRAEGYIAHKWGLAGSLPTSHLFSNNRSIEATDLLFAIDENGIMKSLSALDYEADNNYTITVRAIDENNFYLDKNFTINVTNMVEDIDGDGTENHYDLDDDNDGFTDLDEITYGSNPLDPQSIPNAEPRDLNSTAVLAFSGKPTSGTTIGEFNATDPDGDAITYSLVPFSPVHLSPALWLDASDEATLVKESGFLTSWLDKSGNDRNGISTGSLRPSISSGYNGNSMINLDGVDDVVSINGSFALNTFFVVLNSGISSEKFSDWAWVLGARGPVKTPQMVPALYGRLGDSSLTAELPFQGNLQSVISINGDDTLSQGTKDFGNFSEFKLISVSSSQTSSNLSNWKISSGEFPWKGNIAEVVVFDRPLENHQRYSIEEYLSSKWGLSSKMYRPLVPSNSLFTLDTNGTLKTATTFDYESNASTYTITVQAKDELNATTEGNFTITLLDVYEDTDGDGFRDSLEASTGSNLNDPTSTPLQQGLVAWYPFDGNASDMSGNGNHGTVNGATLGADRHGVAGRAYSFDGVDD